MENVDPGPFAPIVGYVGAICGAVFLIVRLWCGRIVNWKSPEEDLPDTSQKIVALLCGVGMVWIWLYANPQTLNAVVVLSFALVGVTLFSYLFYAFLNGTLLYTKVNAVSENDVEEEPIVGGLWLTRQARSAMKRHGVTIQELFEGAAYDVDKLWSRASRGLAKSLLLFLFLVVMSCGTLGITSAGFAVQVRLTGKPAAEVIHKEDAPGLPIEVGEADGTSDPAIAPPSNVVR